MKKINNTEFNALEAQINIESIIENAIKTWESSNKEKSELLKLIASCYDAIREIFKNIKESNKKNQFTDANSEFQQISKFVNTKIKREAFKLIDGIEHCSTLEIKQISDKMMEYLEQAEEKKAQYDAVLEKYIKRTTSTQNESINRKPSGTIKIEPNEVEEQHVEETTIAETESITSLEQKTILEETNTTADDISDETIDVSQGIQDTTSVQKQPILTEPAEEIFNTIEESIAHLTLPSYAKNIVNILVNSIGEENIANIDNLTAEEFENLINSKMTEISSLPEVIRNNRALNIAFLDEISVCSEPNQNIDEIYLLQEKELEKAKNDFLAGNKELKLKLGNGEEINIKISDSPDIEELDETFNKLSTPLDEKEIKTLINELTSKYTPTIPKNKLNEYLSKQGKYLTYIVEESTPKQLKSKLLRFIYSDFDKLDNTNYLQEAISVIDNERIEKRIDSLIDSIDWSKFK